MMQIDDPLDDRHTQTGAAARGTRLIANDKRIKQRFPDRCRDPGPVIRHSQADAPLLFP